MKKITFSFTPETLAKIEEHKRKQHAEALSTLRFRFNGVADEDVDEQLASDVCRMLEWEDDCRNCDGDTAHCPHGCYIYQVEERPFYSRSSGRFTMAAGTCSVSAQAIAEQHITDSFTRSGIPQERRNDTFINFNTGDDIRLGMAALAAREAAEHGTGLILGGGVGCGKTHLAIAIGNAAIKDGRQVVFSTVSELMERIREELFSSHTSAALEQAKQADVLILDDLGAETLTDWRGEQLLTIINARYNSKRQTVITTNAADTPSFETMLAKSNRAERIKSRLSEMCKKVFITNVPDYRQRKAS